MKKIIHHMRSKGIKHHHVALTGLAIAASIIAGSSIVKDFAEANGVTTGAQTGQNPIPYESYLNHLCNVTVTPSTGSAPLTVTATATGSTGSIFTSIQWGDGAMNSLPNMASGISHTYTATGTFKVAVWTNRESICSQVVTVTDSVKPNPNQEEKPNTTTGGTISPSVVVATGDLIPKKETTGKNTNDIKEYTCSFVVTPAAGNAPLTVKVAAKSSAGSTFSSIQWGDGGVTNSPRTSSAFTYVYKKPGSYQISAFVVDSKNPNGPKFKCVQTVKVNQKEETPANGNALPAKNEPAVKNATVTKTSVTPILNTAAAVSEGAVVKKTTTVKPTIETVGCVITAYVSSKSKPTAVTIVATGVGGGLMRSIEIGDGKTKYALHSRTRSGTSLFSGTAWTGHVYAKLGTYVITGEALAPTNTSATAPGFKCAYLLNLNTPEATGLNTNPGNPTIVIPKPNTNTSTTLEGKEAIAEYEFISRYIALSSDTGKAVVEAAVTTFINNAKALRVSYQEATANGSSFSKAEWNSRTESILSTYANSLNPYIAGSKSTEFNNVISERTNAMKSVYDKLELIRKVELQKKMVK